MSITDVLWWLIYLNSLIVVVVLIYEERDPSVTLTWALALILMPGIGLAFYFLFGRDWRRIATRDRVLAEATRLGNERLEPVYERWWSQAAGELTSRPPFLRRISTAISAQNATRPLPCTDLQIFFEGEQKFDQLFADIENAASSVHLQYFIWEDDCLTERLCEALERKVAEGVEVRVLYDWLGSILYSKKQLKSLIEAGGQVHADVTSVARLNYRNHSKIAVIDGRIAYTGGMNVGQEYTDGGPRFDSWRDTHVRFSGPLVADLQRLFCQRWYRITRESLFGDTYFPELGIEDTTEKDIVWAQVAYSGAETHWAALRNAFAMAILAAEHDVRIQSPYFIPDMVIQSALVSQSLAGVCVWFMMTGIPDKRIAWDAAFSYIDDLVDAGGRMFHYEAGFFHPKAITVDGELAIIGTANFDNRSLLLHDELSIFFYSRKVAEQQNEIFEADLESSREIVRATYRSFSPLRRFRNAVSRLASKLL